MVGVDESDYLVLVAVEAEGEQGFPDLLGYEGVGVGGLLYELTEDEVGLGVQETLYFVG